MDRLDLLTAPLSRSTGVYNPVRFPDADTSDCLLFAVHEVASCQPHSTILAPNTTNSSLTHAGYVTIAGTTEDSDKATIGRLITNNESVSSISQEAEIQRYWSSMTQTNLVANNSFISLLTTSLIHWRNSEHREMDGASRLSEGILFNQQWKLQVTEPTPPARSWRKSR